MKRIYQLLLIRKDGKGSHFQGEYNSLSAAQNARTELIEYFNSFGYDFYSSVLIATSTKLEKDKIIGIHSS